MKYRCGEERKTHFRTDRFYRADSEWYFSTREQVEMGPYKTYQEAQLELTFYLEGHYLSNSLTRKAGLSAVNASRQ